MDVRELHTRMKFAEAVAHKAMACFVLHVDPTTALAALKTSTDQYEKECRIYPCSNCDKMRTAYEGGKTFSLCDDCTSDPDVVSEFNSDPNKE